MCSKCKLFRFILQQKYLNVILKVVIIIIILIMLFNQKLNLFENNIEIFLCK